MAILNPLDVLIRYRDLVKILSDQVPSAFRKTLEPIIEKLDHDFNRIQKPLHRGMHWKAYRESQRFIISSLNEPDQEIIGADKMAALLGWKMQTMRTRFGAGCGILVATINEKQVTVTRLSSFETSEAR